MANSDPLVPFGIAVTIVVGLFIAVPFLRGKSDILTAWNTLLLGVLIFSGLASIEVKFGPGLPYQQLQWFQPSASEVQWYMRANTVFIATLLAAYYFNTPAKKFAQTRLRKWPEASAPVTLFILGYCLIVLMISAALGHATFIGPISSNLALMAAPAAAIFSFQLWYRNRLNMLWLGLFLAAFCGAALYSMVVFTGRRLLMSVFLAPMLYVYWVNVRYWSRPKIAASMVVTCACILAVTAVYSKFRHFSLGNEKRTAGNVVEQIKGLRSKGDVLSSLLRDPLEYVTQNTGDYALLTQRYVDQGVLHPVRLNTVRFLITYPIPRRIWSNKPSVLGTIITRDAARLPTNNWGCGISGHGAFEGGIPALMLYAVLLAFGARIMDEPLKLQPQNPFLIYMLASAIPHLLGIARGDLGTMTMQVGQCVLTAVILGLICRVIFGTQRNPSPAMVNASQPIHSVRIESCHNRGAILKGRN